MEVDFDWQLMLRYAAGVALIGFVVLRTLWPVVAQTASIGVGWFRYQLGGSKPESAEEPSDLPAPKGFAKHVERIKDVAASASADEREQYYLDALTRTQTLEAENRRLNEKDAK